MGILHDALMGFPDRDTEKQYVAHLNSMIKPWLVQCLLGPLIIVICSLDNAASPGSSAAAIVALLGVWHLVTVQVHKTSGTVAFVLVMATFAVVRLAAVHFPSIQKFLIGEHGGFHLVECVGIYMPCLNSLILALTAPQAETNISSMFSTAV